MTALHTYLEELGGEFLTYGPHDESAVRVPDCFGAFEAEYAAIRRRVGVLVLPQQSLLQLRGADTKDFLHRLVTQEINGLEEGQTTRALQLDTKGCVLADMLVHHGGLSTWLEMDRFHLLAVQETLEKRLFAEDVTIEQLDDRVLMVLIGPAALPLLGAVAKHTVAGMTAESVGSMPKTTHVVEIEGALVSATRWDMAGEVAIRLQVPEASAVAVHKKLLEAAGYEAGAEPNAEFAERRRESLRGRPIGWAAYNTARIEAGEVLFGVDFGTDCRPAEAGKRVMAETVSFTKGCYLGQEVVARMQNLGHPKRVVVGLTIDSDHLPVAGSQVLKKGDQGPTLDVIGAVTSSTTSPLMGGGTLMFAMMKWGHHRAGTKVFTTEVGEAIEATAAEPGVESLRPKAES